MRRLGWRLPTCFFLCGFLGVTAAPWLRAAAQPTAAQDSADGVEDAAAGVVSVPSVPADSAAAPANPTAPTTDTATNDPVADPSAPAPTALQLALARKEPVTWDQRLVSAFGLFALLGLCWLISRNRRQAPWRLVAWGMFLQLVFGLAVLKTEPGRWVFARINDGVNGLLAFTGEGTSFLFRSFASGQIEPSLVNFAVQVLPTILVISALMAVLYHVGIMQWVVWLFAVAMQRTMKTSGAETLSTAANIFVGQTEAPLVVKPYVEQMTDSELLAVMVGGFANTAGGVLAAYVAMLSGHFPDIAGHLVAQSVMSAPAALVCAKLVMPELGHPKTGSERLGSKLERIDANVFDAATRGTSEGLGLALNVAAMLLVFIALTAMLNGAVRALGGAVGLEGLSLERVLGWVAWPIAWVMGVPAKDCLAVGELIGIKIVLNEFVAYARLAEMLAQGQPLSHRSVVICSYALSGFANFSSIGIQIGGIAAIAPGRRHDLARLGLLAMFVGCLATFMTAAMAGMLAD